MSTSIEYILYDGSKLFFSRGKCGGAPLASSENDHARYITHSVEGREDVRVCVLGERQVMLNLFLCENKSYFATLTNTDDYDEYNWGADHEKVTVWKYEAGVFRMMQTMPKRHVRSFCLSPDGEVVAVARGATNATIEFLSTTSGETIDSWTCFRGEGYETVPDESNIFNSISLAKINDEYVVAHLRNTVTPQSSGISDSAIKYYYLEENSSRNPPVGRKNNSDNRPSEYCQSGVLQQWHNASSFRRVVWHAHAQLSESCHVFRRRRQSYDRFLSNTAARTREVMRQRDAMLQEKDSTATE